MLEDDLPSYYRKKYLHIVFLLNSKQISTNWIISYHTMITLGQAL